MTSRTALQALADATGSVNGAQDVHDILAQLMIDCRDLVPASGAGVLVSRRPGAVELLAATSHRTTELELFQIQADKGPCQDCIATGALVAATDAQQITDRWGTVGAAIVGAGFNSVHAFPIQWGDATLGGLNLFGAPVAGTPDVVLGQAFANVIGMLLVRRLDLDTDEIDARMQQVLIGRTVIEQAKGLLAYREGIDIGDAYALLLDTSHRNGETVSVTAARLIGSAQRR